MVLISSNLYLVPLFSTPVDELITANAYCGEWLAYVKNKKMSAVSIECPSEALTSYIGNLKNVSVGDGSVLVSFDGNVRDSREDGPFLPVYLLNTAEHGRVLYLSGGKDYATEFGCNSEAKKD